MPSYYDETGKSWYCKFYYTDYTGAKRQKKKRGFKLQRESKEWERSFLERQQGMPDMTFQALFDLYVEDMSHRLRASTIQGKKDVFKNRILPTFKDKPINAITPANIRTWQNEQIQAGYADAYLDRMHNMLTTLFNYAVNYYNLPKNPCKAAGKIGKRTIVVNFWTLEEYNTFIKYIKNRDSHTAFQVLYYSGLRIGELFALTLADCDFKNNTISITKSLQRKDKADIVTPPKTPKSTRMITMPAIIMEELKEYSSEIYGLSATNRLFPFTKSYVTNEMMRACSASGIKRIRTHDIRHSHASLLINLGMSPLIISERLGHEKVETTLNTYSHLYPNKHQEVARQLNDIIVPK